MDTFSRKLGAKECEICATNLAAMAGTIALRSASPSATELRLETLLLVMTFETKIRHKDVETDR